MIKLNGDYDLFGDGAVQFIATPGHTAGHQSLLLNLEKRLKEAQMEHDILKKAVGIFSMKNRRRFFIEKMCKVFKVS